MTTCPELATALLKDPFSGFRCGRWVTPHLTQGHTCQLEPPVSSSGKSRLGLRHSEPAEESSRPGGPPIPSTLSEVAPANTRSRSHIAAPPRPSPSRSSHNKRVCRRPSSHTAVRATTGWYLHSLTNIKDLFSTPNSNRLPRSDRRDSKPLLSIYTL